MGGGILAACLVAGAGCGGSSGARPTTPHELTADEIDANPLALLPGSALAVSTVNARAAYASASVGAELAALSERFAPIGDLAGFKASRDVDRVVAGAYPASQGLDFVAVVSGHFDEAKDQAGRRGSHATPRRERHRRVDLPGEKRFHRGRRRLHDSDPKDGRGGTEPGLRRALERIHDGQPKRDIPPWILETLDTPNAVATLSADLTQPTVTAAITGLSLSWVKGVGKVRIAATLEPPGMRVAGTITYLDADSAAAGASGMRRTATMANLVALTGLTPRLGDLAISAEDTKVHCAFTVDDQALEKLVSLLRSICADLRAGGSAWGYAL